MLNRFILLIVSCYCCYVSQRNVTTTDLLINVHYPKISHHYRYALEFYNPQEAKCVQYTYNLESHELIINKYDSECPTDYSHWMSAEEFAIKYKRLEEDLMKIDSSFMRMSNKEKIFLLDQLSQNLH